MHVRDGTLRKFWGGVQDVCDAAVRQELLVHGHLQILNLSVAAEYFTQVTFVDVLRELLYHDLCAAWATRAARSRA